MFIVGMMASVVATVPVPRFEDVTAASGLKVVSGVYRSRTAGAPVAWVDWDSDGWPDLIIGDAVGATRLYRNHAGQLPFIESTPPALAAIENVIGIDHMVVAPGPLSEDSATPVPGLVFTTAPEAGGELFILALSPTGARRIPIGRPASHVALTTHGDLDGDGSQDIITASAVSGAGAAPVRSVFRLERHPAGYRLSDEDPIAAPGAFPVPLVTDYYGTGQPALLVTTDFGLLDAPSYAYKGGQYETLPGVYGMGIATTDLNGDGVIDYAITSAGPDLLWTSSPDGREPSVVGRNTEWGEIGYRFKWGVVYGDFDNDGSQELWMAVGGTPPDGLIPSDPQGRDVFLSHGEDVANEAGVAVTGSQRAIAVADYDRDGRLDAMEIGALGYTLYHNVTEQTGHWIELRVPDAPGARVQVTACGQLRTRELGGSASAIAHELLLHVGLGKCAGPVTVTVRWPWLYERTYGPFPVDAPAEIKAPGTVWVTPSLVDRRQKLTVHSTLEGAVTVDGVPVVDGVASLTSEDAAGTYRLAVTVDDRPVALAPKYTVAMNTIDLVASPWPLRLGVESRIVGVAPSGSKLAVVAGAILSRHAKSNGNGASGNGAGGNGAGDDGAGDHDASDDGGNKDRWDASRSLTASARDVAITIGGKPLRLAAIANSRPEPVVDLNVGTDSLHVRAALLDELGTPSTLQASSVEVGWSGQERVALSPNMPPWFDGTVPRSTGPLHVLLESSQVLAIENASSAPGPVDLLTSRMWITTPIVRADGQDVVEVALYLRDEAGRLIEPDASWLPTADGCTTIDEAFTLSVRHFGTAAWVAHLRVGTTVGPLRVRAGTLESLVLAVAPDVTPVDITTTLTRTADGFELIPRDRFGQRVGSGVSTDPPFTYDGAGRFTLTSDATSLSVIVANLVVAKFSEGQASVGHYTPNSGGCGVSGAASRPVAPWLLLLAVAVLLATRRRLGV